MEKLSICDFENNKNIKKHKKTKKTRLKYLIYYNINLPMDIGYLDN